MAYEGFFYWKDWENYLGVVDDQGIAKYMNCGTVLLKSADRPRREGAPALPRPRRRVRGVGRPTSSRSGSRSSTRTRSGRPSARTTRTSGPSPSASSTGAIFTPGSGYVNDPQLRDHNLQRAAEAHGGEFLFRARWPRSAARTAASRA